MFLTSLLLLASYTHASTVVGVLYVAGIPAVEGLPSAVYVCDVHILSLLLSTRLVLIF